MIRKKIVLTSCCFILILVVLAKDDVKANGYNFVFPAARHSAVSGYTYADEEQPGHLAYDYRFTIHTNVAAAQKGWIATSFWGYDDGEMEVCDGTLRSRGNYIVLNHTSDDRTEGTGLETWYFHLSNRDIQLTPGSYLHLGKYLAWSGDTGCGPAHLHFATKLNGTPFNPYAGTTHWVSGQPVPMGNTNQTSFVYGPFALSNPKIRDKWVNLQGAPGSPTGNVSTGTCVPLGASLSSATLYKQLFEHGYIYYCGTGSSVYVPYRKWQVNNVQGRFTCGSGDNSIIRVKNVSTGSAYVSITLRFSNGTVRDTRLYRPLLGPSQEWIINVHDVVFAWLLQGEADSPTPSIGLFEGYAEIFADQNIIFNHSYTHDENCQFIPTVLDAYPPP